MQTVYVPIKDDDAINKLDLTLCYGVTFTTKGIPIQESEGYFFTSEELKQLLEEYTNRIIENATTIEETNYRGDYWDVVDKESITSQLTKFLTHLYIN